MKDVLHHGSTGFQIVFRHSESPLVKGNCLVGFALICQGGGQTGQGPREFGTVRPACLLHDGFRLPVKLFRLIEFAPAAVSFRQTIERYRQIHLRVGTGIGCRGFFTYGQRLPAQRFGLVIFSPLLIKAGCGEQTIG